MNKLAQAIQSASWVHSLSTIALVGAFSVPAFSAELWQAEQRYNHGDSVFHAGIEYQAKWWSENTEPSEDAAGPWTLAESATLNGAYNPSYHYEQGQQVRHNGQLWQASWYINAGIEPDISNPHSGWKNLGASDPILDQAIAIRHLDTFSGDDFSDLQALKSSIGDAQIVMLGEQSHGDGNSFKLKARMVEFLHQHMDFDVLVMESGFYDMARVWQDIQAGQTTADASPGNMFYMYAGAQELQGLFSYIDAQASSKNPLILSGLDSQHSGAYAINESLEHLNHYLVNHLGDSVLSDYSDAETARFFDLTDQLFNFQLDVSNDTQEREFYLGYLNFIESQLNTIESESAEGQELTEKPDFWLRFVDSVRGQYLSWRVHGRWTLEGLVDRESEMADNLTWLSEQAYAGKKIIVWGHNLHVQNNPNFVSIRDYLGPLNEQTYSILFTAAQGSFNYWGAFDQNITAVKEGSIEARLSAGISSYQFVDVRSLNNQKRWPEQILGRIWDYSDENSQNFGLYDWPSVTEALIFLREETPSQY